MHLCDDKERASYYAHAQFTWLIKIVSTNLHVKLFFVGCDDLLILDFYILISSGGYVMAFVAGLKVNWTTWTIRVT